MKIPEKDDLISRQDAIAYFFRPYSNEELYSNTDIEKALNALPSADRPTWNISQKDFGVLCVCALRYSHGRRTYIPSDFVQNIVKSMLSELSDETIMVIADDCQFQRTMNLHGDEWDWLKWEQTVKAELERRKP